MKSPAIKAAILTMAFAFTGMAVAGASHASTLDTDRCVFGSSGGMIQPAVSFDTADSGDMYVAIVVNGAMLFKTPGGLTTSAAPFLSNQDFTSSTTLFQVNSLNVTPGTYRLYEVETDAGANVYDHSTWHGSVKKLNFTVGKPTAVSGDFNGDGWPDDDANHDGFHDDDLNQDGYHDDDTNHDGYHDSDTNRNGHTGDDNGGGSNSNAVESHNAGQNCLGCHNYSMAGTVYANATGSSPVQGATVTAQTSSGAIAMTTDALGNFYSTSPVSGAYSVSIQKGPRAIAMRNMRVYGGCNTAGCHSGNSAQGRIYLP